jgi:hypothetical protein
MVKLPAARPCRLFWLLELRRFFLGSCSSSAGRVAAHSRDGNIKSKVPLPFEL